MQATDALDRPPEWPEHRVPLRTIAAFVAILGIAAAALFFVVIMWLNGMSTGAKYGVVFVSILVSSALVGYLMTMRLPKGVADISVVDDALEIKYSSAVFAAIVAMVASLTVFFLGGAVELFLADAVGSAIVLGLLGAYCAVFFVALFTGRIRQGRITLSREGIRHRGWSFESYLPWDAVAGGKAAFFVHRMVNVIAYSNAPWERRNTTRWWRIDELPPVPLIEFDCRKFGVDSLVLFHLVTLYANNPDARAELGTETPLERVRTSSY